jgi:hypothetical protein
MPSTTETYTGWRQVPAHLLTATALRQLEFPRTSNGRTPDAYVKANDWDGHPDTFELFDLRACPPTTSTAAQLDAAQRRAVTSRTCQDCGARAQATLPTLGKGPVPARLCGTCRHIALLRGEQDRFGRYRGRVAADVAAVLTGPPAVVLQLDLHEPPRTDGGNRRPATAARIQVAQLDGGKLLDITVRLVGPRAKWVPAHAIDKADGLAQLHKVISEKRLVLWSVDELVALHKIDPDGGHPGYMDTETWAEPRDDLSDRDGHWLTNARAEAPVVTVETVATQWRCEIDPHTRRLVPCVPPGTPDRLALLLRRISQDAPELSPGTGEPPAATDTNGSDRTTATLTAATALEEGPHGAHR